MSNQSNLQQLLRKHKFIVIFSTQRSGSTMVCQDMCQTGLLGKPEEYFLLLEKHKATESMDLYNKFLSVIEKGSTQNYVSSIKVMANYVNEFGKILLALPGMDENNSINAFFKVYERACWVRVIRRNKIQQAISRVIAEQTKVYHMGLPEIKSTLGSVQPINNEYNSSASYDFNWIQKEVERIKNEEKIWDNLIQEKSLDVIKIYYEDVVDRFDYLYEIAQRLNVSLPALPTSRLIHRLSNQVNEEWYSKFMTQLQSNQVKSHQELALLMNDRLMDISDRLNTVESKVLKDIHHQDNMLMGGNTSAYLKVGKNALSIISFSLIENPHTQYNSILDFPSGWGRVTRWLRAGFPDADLTVCDIIAEATDWCAKKFNAVPVYSSKDFSKVYFSRKFDLIWVGSLVTNLHEDKAKEFFQFAINLLKKNGLLFITLHGRRELVIRRNQPLYEAFPTLDDFERAVQRFDSGFYAYGEYSHTPGYGHSFTPLAWVSNLISQYPDVIIASFKEKGWNNHQDVLILKKASISE
jgi:LPS sulfotransferase NodH/SAM-dependent methyltransferase